MKTRSWAILFALLAGVSMGAWFFLNRGGQAGGIATVTFQGRVLKTIDLSKMKNEEFTVTGENGLYNIVEVQDGRIRVREANCPDQICVHRGWGSSTAEPIICLPNGLVITIDRETAIDGIAG